MNWNPSDAKKPQFKQAGIMFMFSGIAFMVAFALADQVAFIGVGAGLIGVGAAFIAKARQADGAE